MKTTLENKRIDSTMLSVPEFNFGQMQRWKGHTRLRYSIEIKTSFFIEQFGTQFEAFREEEILEDDSDDLVELERYKVAGWPTLLELLDHNQSLLKDLIIFHEYDVLHSIIKNEHTGGNFYSINSIDTVSIEDEGMKFEGICFKVTRNN